MCPYIHIILPSYAVLAFIGGFVTLFYVYTRLETYQIEFTELLKLFLGVSIGVLVGSKLLFALTQISWLAKHFTWENLLLLIPQSGFVFYGGLFGALIAIQLVTRKRPVYREKVYALLAPAFPLFHGFGRLGCFMAGCCYGKMLSSPIHIASVVELDRIPIQLIEAGYEFGLFFLINYLGKHKKEWGGIRIYLLFYAVFRLVIEFWRGDEVRGIYFGLSTAQWISIGIIVYYMVKCFYRRIVKSGK